MDSMDLNFDNLSKNQMLSKYIENVNRLRILAQHNNITDSDFSEYLTAHINKYTYIHNTNLIIKSVLDRKRKIIWCIFALLFAYTLVSYKHEASSVVLRNLQTFIYPGMKLWRKMTVPVITHFPSLTELYDESCLVNNPFFQVEDLNCDPCSDVPNVLDLTNYQYVTNDVPFIFKTQQKLVTVDMFYDIYTNNEDIFKHDAYKISSTNKEVKNIDDLASDFLNNTHQSESHNVWRCTRMDPARILRKYFPRPARIPATGIGLERFLLFDTPAVMPYRIPDTECSNVFIIQALGTRTIVLRPTTECKQKCRTISIKLPTSYALNYNWWYWKPISVPDAYHTSPSVSYIGSYC